MNFEAEYVCSHSCLKSYESGAPRPPRIYVHRRRGGGLRVRHAQRVLVLLRARRRRPQDRHVPPAPPTQHAHAFHRPHTPTSHVPRSTRPTTPVLVPRLLQQTREGNVSMECGVLVACGPAQSYVCHAFPRETASSFRFVPQAAALRWLRWRRVHGHDDGARLGSGTQGPPLLRARITMNLVEAAPSNLGFQAVICFPGCPWYALYPSAQVMALVKRYPGTASHTNGYA